MQRMDKNQCLAVFSIFFKTCYDTTGQDSNHPVECFPT
jgi:hypothetical protein